MSTTTLSERILANLERFVESVIRRFFYFFPRETVDWQNVLQEARVAIFQEDQSGRESRSYLWRVAEAIGKLLWQDYGIKNRFVRRNPNNLFQCNCIDIADTRRESNPAFVVENKDWIAHHLRLARRVLRDKKNQQRSYRRITLFEMWIRGYSLKEILRHPKVTWLKNTHSVCCALRDVLGRLWDFFGVDRKSHVMLTGGKANARNRESTGKSRKELSREWYTKNRELHLLRCRDYKLRARKKRLSSR